MSIIDLTNQNLIQLVPRKNNSKNSASSRDNGVDSLANSTNQWKFMSAYYACILCMMSHTGPDDITQQYVTVEITYKKTCGIR